MTKQMMSILQVVMDRIQEWAADAGRDECMGLLAASPAGDPFLITSACRLAAEASGSHAVADPVAIKRAADRLSARRAAVRGIWHSHGLHGVFHSATDDDTAERILPAMAEAAFRRPRHAWPAPAVVASDRALLPLPDGRVQSFVLVGPPVDGLDGYEPAAWSRVVTTFRKARHAPRAVQEGDALHLEGCGVRLSLGVPEGASVLSGREDTAALRTATLFSLVVNLRGDRYAEALVVREADGQTWLDRGPCAIEVVGDARGPRGIRRGGAADAAGGANGLPVALGEGGRDRS